MKFSQSLTQRFVLADRGCFLDHEVDDDNKLVRNNPKIVSGMSDNTLLHHFCYANGLRPFYGPSALTQLGEWPQPLEFTWKNFLRAVTVPEPMGPLPCSPEYTDEVADRSKEPEQISNGTMRPRTMKPSRGWRWLQGGRAEGEVWGGCLPSLFQLMNTKWEVSYQGKIAFIGTTFPFSSQYSLMVTRNTQGFSTRSRNQLHPEHEAARHHGSDRWAHRWKTACILPIR